MRATTRARYRQPVEKLNKWLNSSVNSYIEAYGKTDKPTIYEVGSRDGNDGVELATRIYNGTDLWNDADIVLFECNPPSVEVVKHNHPRATVITNAISDVSGDVVEFLQIHGDKNMVGSSTLNTKRNDSWIKETTTIKVTTKRLDEIIEDLGHQKTQIDIMKIDIEGYTAEALRSLGKYLRNVKVFHLETEIEGIARAETNLDIALFMQERGYVCKALENEWGQHIQDQVWLRR